MAGELTEPDRFLGFPLYNLSEEDNVIMFVAVAATGSAATIAAIVYHYRECGK